MFVIQSDLFKKKKSVKMRMETSGMLRSLFMSGQSPAAAAATTPTNPSVYDISPRLSLLDSCHKKIRLISGAPVAFLGGLVAKARRKDKEPSSSGGEDPKLYLEEAVLERKLQDIDLRVLVALPAGLDYNEWLASHTIAFFEHINLVYGTVSEFCTMSGCPEMNGPGLRTYLWFDEKGKKTRVPAPQYIDYVMTFIQKTVSDEALFPTKYANEFPSSFESLVRKILRLLFHVLAHLYHCHFREVVLLNLHTQLNCVFAHLTLFNHTFQLIEPKETEILQDLVVALKIHSDSDKDGTESPSLVKSDSNNAKNKSPKKSDTSFSSTNSNTDNTKLNYNSQDLVISNEPKLVVPDLESSDHLQRNISPFAHRSLFGRLRHWLQGLKSYLNLDSVVLSQYIQRNVAVNSSYQFVAAIVEKSASKVVALGVVVSPHWVLANAHVFPPDSYGLPYQNYSILAGRPWRMFFPTFGLTHPAFTWGLYTAEDLALFYVDDEIPARQVFISAGRFPWNTVPCDFLYWLETANGTSIQGAVMSFKNDVTVMQNCFTKAQRRPMGLLQFYLKDILCAKSHDERPETCVGHQGGILYCQNLLVGFLLRSDWCPKKTANFTDVGMYTNWLQSRIRNGWFIRLQTKMASARVSPQPVALMFAYLVADSSRGIL